MATSGRGSGVVGYTVQVAVETEYHLIVAHEVTNDGCDRAQLSAMSQEAKAVLEVDQLDAVADRGSWDSEEILACDRAGVSVTLPKPMTSGAKAGGRFGQQDFVYLPEEDACRCPGDVTLTGNTALYWSRKNLAPGKINDLDCAKADRSERLRGYTQLT
jgi:transposase